MAAVLLTLPLLPRHSILASVRYGVAFITETLGAVSPAPNAKGDRTKIMVGWVAGEKGEPLAERATTWPVSFHLPHNHTHVDGSRSAGTGP